MRPTRPLRRLSRQPRRSQTSSTLSRYDVASDEAAFPRPLSPELRDLLEKRAPGIFSNLAILYSQHKPEKLMDFIKMNTAKIHIPKVGKFDEKFYFAGGNLGFPVFETAVGKVGVYICYDRHFPEGWYWWRNT